MRQRRHALALLLIALLAVSFTGCAKSDVSQKQQERRYLRLKSGTTYRLDPAERTAITVPEGWNGDQYIGDITLYDESSLIGTVSVLPHASSEVRISGGEEIPVVTVMAFPSTQDFEAQKSIYTKIWTDSMKRSDLSPLVTYSPAPGVTSTCSVDFDRNSAGIAQTVRVVAFVANPDRVCFQVVGDFLVTDPMFKGTESNEDIVRRLFEFLLIEY